MPLARLALWVLSLAGVLAALAVFVAAAPPVSVLLLGLVLQLALATTGVLVPSWRVFGNAVGRGPRERPEVALTFDDGPHPETTPRVLAILREHDARATFFVIGKKARAHPELVRAIAAAGHTVGVHGYEHDRLYALRSRRFVERDIARACAELEALLGARPTLYRPPIGFVSAAVASACERARLTLVGFTRRALDGRAAASPARVLARATAALENGAIVVLHDAAERDDYVPASLTILPELLTRLRARRLEAVTVDALLRPF